MDALSKISGLSVEACKELTDMGFVYIREINKPNRWEQQF